MSDSYPDSAFFKRKIDRCDPLLPFPNFGIYFLDEAVVVKFNQHLSSQLLRHPYGTIRDRSVAL